MENNEKDKKNYEISFLVKSEDDIQGVLSFLTQHNAEAITEPRAKKLALAYEIQKCTEAVFVYCNFKAAGVDAKKLEQNLTMKHDVLRSIILSLPSKIRVETPREGTPAKTERAPRMTDTREEVKISSPRTLSNEALEKKIEEILQ